MGISFNQNIDNAYVTYSIFGPSYEILASVSGSSTRDIYNMFDSVESWYDDFKLKLSCKFDPIVTQSREQHFTMLFDQLKETCIKN
ncbi:hypothetical protein JKY79_01155 [Candidatus Babeliales bacterium]|nr:hypothetical protein [Candidatus Babeliales bacterium]